MKTKVVGLFLTTLMALSLVGVGYAYWTDTLYLDGSVTTGTFWGYLTLGEVYDDEGKDVGSVVAELGGAEVEADGEPYCKALTITIDDAYPGYLAYVNWDMHWLGSVPAHVSVTHSIDQYPWLLVRVTVTDSTHPDIPYPWSGTLEEFIALIERSQWHNCYEIWVEFEFEIFEDDLADPIIDPPQMTTVGFDIDFNFYQYNTVP